MTLDQIKTVQALCDALTACLPCFERDARRDLNDYKCSDAAREAANERLIRAKSYRALIEKFQQEAQAAPAEDRSPHTVMTLDIRHYPEPEPNGSWVVFGPVGSGLNVCGESIDDCMADVVGIWRFLAANAPNQVPPVPAAPPKAPGRLTYAALSENQVRELMQVANEWAGPDEDDRRFDTLEMALRRLCIAVPQPKAQAPQAGEWVTVPREPTEAMLCAAFGYWLDIKGSQKQRATAVKEYRAMLAAAPPQAAQHDPLACAPLQREDTAAGAEQQREAQAAQEPADEADVTELRNSLRKLIDECEGALIHVHRDELELLMQAPDSDDSEWRRRVPIFRLQPEAQTPDSAEPVAWLHTGTKLLRHAARAKGSDFEPSHWTPLYTHPAVTLTDEDIDATFRAHHNSQDTPWANWRRFARAILARAVGGNHA